MTDRGYNPDDPGFLASRRLDEELPAEAQARLDAALSASPALREEAEQLRAVDDLVKRWGAGSEEVDSEPFVKSVVGAVESQHDSVELRRVDSLLAGWRDEDLGIDSDRFVEGVMGRVAPRRRAPGHQWIIRLGVPLAAAAAVMFAVTTTLQRGSIDQDPGSVSVDWGTVAGTVEVAFARSADPSPADGLDNDEIGFVSVGAGPALLLDDEAPPS